MEIENRRPVVNSKIDSLRCGCRVLSGPHLTELWLRSCTLWGWNAALEDQYIVRVTLLIGSSAVREQQKHMGLKSSLASLAASLGLP